MEFNTILTIVLGLLIMCCVGLIMLIGDIRAAKREVEGIKGNLSKLDLHDYRVDSRISSLEKDIEDIKDKQHQLCCKEEALHNYLGVVPVWVATDETLEELQVALVSKKEEA